jgi:hypothetical protein
MFMANNIDLLPIKALTTDWKPPAPTAIRISEMANPAGAESCSIKVGIDITTKMKLPNMYVLLVVRLERYTNGGKILTKSI